MGFNSSVTMIAIRDIVSGEELVMNYAFMETDFEAFACQCGTAACRGEINKDTWRVAEFQKQYSTYYSPYLKDKIR